LSLPFRCQKTGTDKIWLQKAQDISIYHSTPTIYRYFTRSLSGNDDLSNIRLVILGGEAVQKDDFETFKKHFAIDCMFANLFGQSESSLNLVYFMDHGTPLTRGSVPMGYPVDDTEVLLFDSSGLPTELYGEIGIRSSHLALGYWKRPELTESVFASDVHQDGKRLYRTGDMARLLCDGSLGLRDERSSGKNSWCSRRTWRDESVWRNILQSRRRRLRLQDVSGDKYLVAYLVAKGNSAPSSIDTYLSKQKLPLHMIPSCFVLLESCLSLKWKVESACSARSEAKHFAIRSFVAPRDRRARADLEEVLESVHRN
jgi:acyl-CoA synthetase (AMP-forming)/AMP-acid ligase II